MFDKFVSRKALDWPATPAGRTITNQGMVAHYDAGYWLRNRRRDLKKADKSQHIACKEYWNRVRSQHRGQSWVDVGYAYFSCPDGYVFAGREVNHQQAAQAPTPGKRQNGNSRYVAVTFGLGPGEMPTDEAIEGWHRLRSWLMKEHGVSSAVYGHRDFTATSCPGDVIYALRNNRLKTAPKAAPATPPKIEPQPEENVTMDYASFGASAVGPTDAPAGTWVDVNFDTEYADPTNSHPDKGSNPTILLGKPYIYALEFGADVEGAAPGDVVDVQTSEFKYNRDNNPPTDDLVEKGKVQSVALTDQLRLHFAAVGSLRKNGKLRIRVRSHSAADVKITNARVSVVYSE